VVVWRLDPLGRSLKHLITVLDHGQALGVAFVSMAEGIDATTPAGRLQMQILGAIAEFERARIVERVRLGLARARASGHASWSSEVCHHRRAVRGPIERVAARRGAGAWRQWVGRPPVAFVTKTPGFRSGFRLETHRDCIDVVVIASVTETTVLGTSSATTRVTRLARTTYRFEQMEE